MCVSLKLWYSLQEPLQKGKCRSIRNEYAFTSFPTCVHFLTCCRVWSSDFKTDDQCRTSSRLGLCKIQNSSLHIFRCYNRSKFRAVCIPLGIVSYFTSYILHTFVTLFISEDPFSPINRVYDFPMATPSHATSITEITEVRNSFIISTQM